MWCFLGKVTKFTGLHIELGLKMPLTVYSILLSMMLRLFESFDKQTNTGMAGKIHLSICHAKLIFRQE